MQKKELLYEGKAKKVYLTSEEDKLIQEFKDDATAFDGAKKGTISKKGEINNAISAYLFEYLENYHIPTHYFEKLSANEMLIRKLEIIPIEIVLRNVAAGSLCARYNIPEGKVMEYPILEYYLKDDELHDPMINEYHAYAFGHATPDEMKAINRIASKVNAILKSFFDRRNLVLVDFKLEFGKRIKDIYLADEISPDTCRIWDKKTHKKLDKDRFRHDMGGVDKAYRELRDRLMGD
ncbi:phosphoribosylaminoimidazolesuccinocarboxamide synthase [candidate division LCP-89 bacterium B3_LCP]|uniref:Phosphoribosylaminoimidazole-succinocarboxamide synthase n=1 Tax=candidate division LCP-89 bacterium B3_LCP TaxID=2012998 RepID=A0A532UZ65_UNCL8|nr:MAG: phosphoribosylaminoimidazolesuccinocarboxamide synthase [candidate division LCP-89 bacterium B3_LCP]